ncbi:hypothetical protein ABS71_22550 [bacterium SCN 62-11]|nr:hypothetical protein [Candidatus Eremiobacteraeota bacterium]ODT55847.1 MAG: hypothetical protein ABS71_22550 [bacterium SCN 62-11]
MLGLATYAHPATARLQLLHQHQQFVPGFLGKDRTRDVDDVGLEDFHKGEIFQHELSTAAGQIGDALAKVNIGRQQIHANRLGAEGHRGRENHFPAAATQVVETLALFQTGHPANLHARKVGRLAEAKVLERPIRKRFSLEINVERQKAPEVEKPHEALHLD